MGLIYLVRRKKFRTVEGFKELYYAVQRKLQKRGGKNEYDLADILSANSGRSKGDVLSILTDLPEAIEKILKEGESVTIRGLGSFHAAITSDGFEHPEDVLPHEVRLSKVYFVADRKFTYRVSKMQYYRYPLSKYFPKSVLRPETIQEEAAQEEAM
ncbi:HU family DNA-binding protein [Bacteroides sp.]